jgi:hypothetical protein
MRYLFGFMCVLALGVVPLVGCGEDTCARGCNVANVMVNLNPWVIFTYDVDLVLDGASGAFTCKGSDSGWTGLTNQTGIGQTVVECGAPGFEIQATPESVEISVTAQDGSWTGSVKESPDYVRLPTCPGESELCPPLAVVTIRGSVLTDCTGFEDGTQCMSGELEGICLGGACAVSADCSGLENGTPCVFEDDGRDFPGRCSDGGCVAECQVLEEGTPCLQFVGGEMGVCEAGVCVVQNQREVLADGCVTSCGAY